MENKMTTKTKVNKNDNGYGDFEGTEVGMPLEEKWAYPPIGYNSRDGAFYIGEAQQPTIDDMVLLAMRQCKEVDSELDGSIHRYPIRTRKSDMIAPDAKPRWQGIVYVNDELHVFGARSWTARAAFMNPGGGPYSDDKFEQGLWHALNIHVKNKGVESGKQMPPLCWQFSIAAEENVITVGSGKNTSQAHRIKQTAEFTFVGSELANKLLELYQAEDIDGWVAEWGKRSVQETAEVPEQSDINLVSILEDDDIPF
jgi:hypothetical protein